MQAWAGIQEDRKLPTEEDRPAEYTYQVTGACTIRALWVDAHGACWLESLDGQHVVIPPEIRNLVARRVREAKFR